MYKLFSKFYNLNIKKQQFRYTSQLKVQVKTLINQLSLSWGVRAFHYSEETGIDDIIDDEIEILKERGFIKTGDVVVNTGSLPVQLHLPTNLLKITKVH